MEEKRVGIEILKNPKGFIDYSQTIEDVCEYLEDYNPTKKRRVLIVLKKKTQHFTCFYISYASKCLKLLDWMQHIILS